MQQKSRFYCRMMFLSVGGMTFVIALLNWIVDPYDIYSHALSSEFRSGKSRLVHRIAKAEVAKKGQYDVLLLGDSRVGALDPDHSALKEFGNSYNLGLAAGSIYEESRVLDLAFRSGSGRPKLVVWGIVPEFIIRDRRPGTEFDFDSSLLNAQLNTWDYHLRNLLGIDATLNSLSVLSNCLLKERDAIAHPEISKGVFKASVTSSTIVPLERFVETLPSAGSYLAEHEPLPTKPEREELLRSLLNRSRQRGTIVKIFIPPDHALYFERLNQLGQLDRVEDGKRTLVRLVSEANSLEPSTPPIEVWDFSGLTDVTIEDPPTENHPARMNWRIDAIHFTHKLGDVVLNRMFALPVDLEGFGVQLTANNIEQHLGQQRMARAHYRRIHSAQLQIAIGETRSVQ